MLIFRLFLVNYRYFGHNTYSSGISVKTKAPIDIYVTTKFFIQSCPLFVDVLRQAPLEETRNLYPELHTVCVAG